MRVEARRGPLAEARGDERVVASPEHERGELRHRLDVGLPLGADVDGRAVQAEDAASHRLVDVRRLDLGEVAEAARAREPLDALLDRHRRERVDHLLARARRLPELRHVVPLVLVVDRSRAERERADEVGPHRRDALTRMLPQSWPTRSTGSPIASSSPTSHAT